MFHAWAPPALTGTECHHCSDMSLSSQLSRLAFFSESSPAPQPSHFFSSQEPERKKQRGRGSQHSEMSELTLAVPPHYSLSPHREFSPVLFTRPDQHPSAAVSDLVSFGGSDDARWTAACHWQLQMQRSCRARSTILPPCIQPRHGRRSFPHLV